MNRSVRNRFNRRIFLLFLVILVTIVCFRIGMQRECISTVVSSENERNSLIEEIKNQFLLLNELICFEIRP